MSLIFPIVLLVLSACMEVGGGGTTFQTPTGAETFPSAEIKVSPTLLPPTSTSLTPPVSLTPRATRAPIYTPTPFIYPTREPTPVFFDGFAQIEVGEYFVNPSMLTITVGTIVEWTSVGQNEHTIISLGENPDWPKDGSVGDVNSQTFRATFMVPGVFPYYCSYHPSVMDGIIFVIEQSESESP